MKTRTTRKEIQNSYNKIIKVGYCNLQYLLKYKYPSYYWAGTYGWNADIYDINDVLIVTGYRTFGNYKGVNCGKYEEKARKIVRSNNNQKEKLLDELLDEFIKETLEHGKSK